LDIHRKRQLLSTAISDGGLDMSPIKPRQHRLGFLNELIIGGNDNVAGRML
jgi:hypothetical protein